VNLTFKIVKNDSKTGEIEQKLSRKTRKNEKTQKNLGGS